MDTEKIQISMVRPNGEVAFGCEFSFSEIQKIGYVSFSNSLLDRFSGCVMLLESNVDGNELRS